LLGIYVLGWFNTWVSKAENSRAELVGQVKGRLHVEGSCGCSSLIVLSLDAVAFRGGALFVIHVNVVVVKNELNVVGR
jgi:hypothetical protein